MSKGEMARVQRRHKDRVARLRRKLEARGYAPEYVEAMVQRLRSDLQDQRDRMRARGDRPAADLDGTGYTPRPVDPLLHGAARATGATAKAVRRGKAFTKWEHDHAEGGAA